jgi:cellulose synthase/poly-beta-1,6-N-acetylglucosamine synthase-like glycosyltransferase
VSAEVLFWTSLAFLAYTYAGYPAVLWLVARKRLAGAQPARPPDSLPSVTVVIAAHNESANIGPKLESIAALDYPRDRIATIVVSDGSTDATAEVARAFDRVQVIVQPARAGKAAALNAACAVATGEVLMMTDARQRLAPGTLRALVARLEDPAVGVVGGELMLHGGDTGVSTSIGAYWTYEKFVRRAEAALGRMIGVSGAIYAIRARDWTPLRPGTILDDLIVPMRVMRRGRRIVFEPAAQAFDVAETDLRREKRRKLRTLAGNFQAFAYEPWLLLPWAYPGGWQFWSHKVFRLLAPYALLGVAVGSLAATGWIYHAAAAVQAFCYGAALLAGLFPAVNRNRFAALCRVFVEMHLTAARALPAFVRGRADSLWTR